MITLSDEVMTVTLSPDLYWSDEFSYSPVRQTVTPNIQGSLTVQSATLLAGRHITLVSKDNVSGGITHGDLVKLRAWSQIAGKVMQLMLRGVERDVIFRHHEVPLEVDPLVHYSEMDDSDYYIVQALRLMEVNQ